MKFLVFLALLTIFSTASARNTYTRRWESKVGLDLGGLKDQASDLQDKGGDLKTEAEKKAEDLGVNTDDINDKLKDLNGSSCKKSEDCARGEFCHKLQKCTKCENCEFCSLGIDDTCGSNCGTGFPTHEKANTKCEATTAENCPVQEAKDDFGPYKKGDIIDIATKDKTDVIDKYSTKLQKAADSVNDGTVKDKAQEQKENPGADLTEKELQEHFKCAQKVLPSKKKSDTDGVEAVVECDSKKEMCLKEMNCSTGKMKSQKSYDMGTCTNGKKVSCIENDKIKIDIYSDSGCTKFVETKKYQKGKCMGNKGAAEGTQDKMEWEGVCSSATRFATLLGFLLAVALF